MHIYRKSKVIHKSDQTLTLTFAFAVILQPDKASTRCQRYRCARGHAMADRIRPYLVHCLALDASRSTGLPATSQPGPFTMEH
eukprot:scaffold197346_cov43-Prasinocladus_malaysianus.AAC.1